MDVLFVSTTCRGCRMVLGHIKSAPHVLRFVDVKYLDNDPAAHLELAKYNVRAVPTLVVKGPDGRVLRTVTGAGQVINEMVQRYSQQPNPAGTAAQQPRSISAIDRRPDASARLRGR